MAGSLDDRPVERGLMVCPARGWRWLVFRLPFWLWRMALRPS